MAKIVIDGKEYEVNPDNNLLQECLSQGLDLPYFCWHPCMGSVGACRQCAVKQYRDEDDEQGMLVMSCMTPVADGMRVSIEDEQAKDMRERVIESLMISHPHDCPVCEEGGECHLQDMTLMSGHNYRRYDKKKRTHRNQYLGPFINHEMNRCIACYRCVRYYDDYAGGTDLAAQASHHHVYFGRHEDGVLESEFSGNLVEVCPTGVFTDQAFSEHYTRKWDLQTAPSVCVGCSVGCNTTPGERYGSLRRITNRYNSEVNGYFLCDRGRFGFDYVNSDQRLRTAVAQANGTQTELEASQVSAVLAEMKAGAAIGIGSPRASNEANYALRCLVGEENFYAGVADDEHEVNQLILSLARDKAFHAPSGRDIEDADAVLIIGEDVTNTAPRLALSLRQSVRNKAKELAQGCNIPEWQDAAVRELAQHERSPLSILSAYATRLDDIASEVVIGSYAEQAAITNAIAAQLSGNAPKVDGLDSDQQALVETIANQLANARRPLVVSGSSNGQVELVKAAANVARALHEKKSASIDLCLVMPEVNSFGLEMLVRSENSLGSALEKMQSGAVKKATVLENDLYRRASTANVDSALQNQESLLVLDLLPTRTSEKATHILPATAFSEHEATYVNYEGRAQLSFQVHRCNKGALPAWQWLHGDDDIDGIIKECGAEANGFDKLDDLLPRLDQFVAGLKVPRQSHRYSGRTAMIANINVHEPKQPVDEHSVMSFSMEGMPATKDASVLGAAWAPSWNSNQSISKFQDEINGELKQGHTGFCLVERSDSGDYLAPQIDEVTAGEGELVLSRAQQIFGSDELSARSSTIQQRLTDSYLGIAPVDADKLGIAHGDEVSLDGNGATAVACIRAQIKPGTAALYAADQVDVYSLPAAIAVQKASSSERNRNIDGLIISDIFGERQ